jgi:hypothetical protein
MSAAGNVEGKAWRGAFALSAGSPGPMVGMEVVTKVGSGACTHQIMEQPSVICLPHANLFAVRGNQSGTVR